MKGFILSNGEDPDKKLNSAVFPGLQGGSLMYVIAAKAMAFGEAFAPEYCTCMASVCENAKGLAETLRAGGIDTVSGGTHTHLMLADLRPKGLTGKAVEATLERAHITRNKNGIPFVPEPPMVPSGIRLGTPTNATRGFGIEVVAEIGRLLGSYPIYR